MWYNDFAPLGKNAKLTPKWQGPAKNTELNYTNTCIVLPSGKSKVLNFMRLKKFFMPESQETQNKDYSPLDFNSERDISGSMTRAMKKLIKNKNPVQLAMNILCDLSKEHCTMWE